jgi:hypothetical protein
MASVSIEGIPEYGKNFKGNKFFPKVNLFELKEYIENFLKKNNIRYTMNHNNCLVFCNDTDELKSQSSLQSGDDTETKTTFNDDTETKTTFNDDTETKTTFNDDTETKTTFNDDTETKTTFNDVDHNPIMGNVIELQPGCEAETKTFNMKHKRLLKGYRKSYKRVYNVVKQVDTEDSETSFNFDLKTNFIINFFIYEGLYYCNVKKYSL